MAAKNVVQKSSDTFLTFKKTYARFDNKGMTVDLDGYFRTAKGGSEFRSLAQSAFGRTSKAAVKK